MVAHACFPAHPWKSTTRTWRFVHVSLLTWCRSHNDWFLALPQIVKKSQAGGGVAVKIEHAVYQSAKMFGRHFDDKDELYSKISRQSIDVLKVSSLQRWIYSKWALD